MSKFNPASQDIADIDEVYPPFFKPFILESHGAKLNAVFYGANGRGPHPTAILLHGYPGNEKNLDLAQALRRSGLNVLFCHYRGTWGSGGVFTFDNAIADTHAFIDYLQSLPVDNELRVDSSQISLVGHSVGGYLALMVGSSRKEIRRIVTIAPVNMALALAIPAVQETPEFWLENSVVTAPLDEFTKELYEKRSSYDSFAVLGGFVDRDVLLVGAGRDELLPTEQFLYPLIAEFKKHPTVNFEHHILNDDHSFSGHRIALAQVVTEWLQETQEKSE